MADVLADLVAHKRQEVAARLGGRTTAAETTGRSLRTALARPRSRFIMEVKRASPSGHRARHSLDAAVAAYAGIADAISVLVDAKGFGGSLDDLRAVRARFDGPILAKDFTVDPAQVSEARACGADAVLAMLSVLSNEEAAAVIAEARRLGMDVLVEIHDEAELARALVLDAPLIGINNRDLKTLKTDLSVTRRLAPLVPADRLVIAESGIAGRRDVEALAPFADAFLVGSSLMAADDIGESARALVHGPVKICGLTREEDVRASARAGATHAGFIFHPRSKRRLTKAAAMPLVEAARSAGLKPVAVFDGADPAIAATAHDLGLYAVQIHGPVPIGLKDALGDIALWAVSASTADGLSPVDGQADRTLFDTGPGGTGQAFDWSLLEGRRDLARAFLAGGITPRNAAAASRVGAYGLDLSSGVEASPGIKDPDLIDALFGALRSLSRKDRPCA